MGNCTNFPNLARNDIFGLDKSSAHTFKLPKQTTEAIMRVLELGGDRLQTDIQLNIGGKYYPATARVWRGNRKRLENYYLKIYLKELG